MEMWQPEESSTRIVEASRSRLADAFDAWQRANGRAARGTNAQSSHLFVKAIASQLDLSRDDPPSKLGLPTSRSTWSSWRSGRGKPNLKLRLDVCRSIMALTGVDATSNGFLGSAPVNVTDMVTLGAVQIVASSADTAKGNKEIQVDWIDFRVSAAKDVTLDLAKKSPDKLASRYRIGSVRYVLKEASIFVQPAENLHPIATYLGDGTNSDEGKAQGLELSIDRDDFSRWRVQPSYPREALQARLEVLRLCQGEISSVKVGVSATKGDIEPQIFLDGPIDLSRDEYQNTRERLIAQVLRNRMKDPGLRQRFVLSHAVAVAK